jgi:23S rRNA pseudouridine2604 synthase
VDGKVVQVPETRVRPEQVVILRKDAKPEAIPPVTILMNKPAGMTQGRPMAACAAPIRC